MCPFLCCLIITFYYSRFYHLIDSFILTYLLPLNIKIYESKRFLLTVGVLEHEPNYCFELFKHFSCSTYNIARLTGAIVLTHVLKRPTFLGLKYLILSFHLLRWSINSTPTHSNNFKILESFLSFRFQIFE